MIPPRTLVLPGIVALLVACANPSADQARYAQTALLGMPEQTLLSCAGAPERSYAAGGREYLTYASRELVARPGFGVGLGFFGGSRHFGYGIGVPLASDYDVASNYCEATFTVEGGRVTQVNYVGGPYPLGQCYYIVRNCLALVPQPAPRRY